MDMRPDLLDQHRHPWAHTRPGRIAIFLFGSAAYASFLGVFLYALGFVMGVGTPTRLDAPATGPLLPAAAINLGLLALFALQHSVMARRSFKRWWTRFVPIAAERSVYVLATNLALAALFAFWQPMGPVVWDAHDPSIRAALIAVGAVGWLIVLASTFLINHFDLFGLRQVWLHLRARPYQGPRFRTPALYRVVRHPLYVGWLLAFWGAPTMTLAHLLFALVTTAYILTAIRLEERDLLAEHGTPYAEYRARVPMLVPRPLRRAPRPATA